jgi:hypothetical protein
MRTRLQLLSVAALLSSTTPLFAQATTSLATGTRVRVTSLAANLIQDRGTIAASEGDTVFFHPDSAAHCDTSCPAVRLTPDELDRLEVYKGRSPVRGALVGGAVGGVAGLIVDLVMLEPNVCDDDQQPGLDAAGKCGGEAIAGPIIAGGVGALAGVLVGAAIGVGERWHDVRSVTPLVDVALTPTRHGIALTLRAAF